MITHSSIQTCSGSYEIMRNDKILVHEHIFNRYPFWHQQEMENFVLKELQDASNQGISMVCDLTAYTKPYHYYLDSEKVAGEKGIEIPL